MSPSSDARLDLPLDLLNACIHCGMCLPACPTYQVTGSEAESPRGRIYLMRGLMDGELTDAAAVKPHIDQCLACHACETACPSGVQYGSLLMATREQLAASETGLGNGLRRAFKRFAMRHVLPNHDRLLQLAALLRFYQQSGLQNAVRRLGVLRVLGLADKEALLPPVPAIRRLSEGLSFGDPQGERVALFVGCVMDVFYNPVHWATVTVLGRNGFHVIVPDQTCCGALAHHAGELDIARELAKENTRKVLARNPVHIVVNAGGCGSTMQEYGHLLSGSRPAAEFAEKTIDVMGLLAQKPLAAFDRPVNRTVTYHASCHVHHVQKLTHQTQDLLKQVPGLRLEPLTGYDTCCGSAGVYNVEHPELAGEILDMKTTHLRAVYERTGADTVVTGNPGCMLQIAKGLNDAGIPMRVQHPIEILAEGYR